MSNLTTPKTLDSVLNDFRLLYFKDLMFKEERLGERVICGNIGARGSGQVYRFSVKINTPTPDIDVLVEVLGMASRSLNVDCVSRNNDS